MVELSWVLLAPYLDMLVIDFYGFDRGKRGGALETLMSFGFFSWKGMQESS